MIVLKENHTRANKFFVDLEDKSITRTKAHLEHLFHECNLRIKATELQRGFPSSLFPVRLYALAVN